jgi:hypothetical protein
MLDVPLGLYSCAHARRGAPSRIHRLSLMNARYLGAATACQLFSHRNIARRIYAFQP